MSLEFDSSFYLKQYPDIKKAGIDPEWHFKNYGAAEGRAPNAELLAVAKGFDADAYLNVNQDVANAIDNGANLTAYKHWVLYGRFEAGRPEATYNGGTPVSEPVPSLENTFDADEYLSLYPDVANANIDPLWHFKNYGAAEGRAPNKAYADAGVNGNTFDANAYLAENPDIAAAINNGANLTAYQHWVLYGQFEARPEATLTDGRTVTEALNAPAGNGSTFTLTEVTTSEQLEEIKQSIEPNVEKVIYWGNASTGEGVPAESVFGNEPLAGAMLEIIDGISADGLSDLLAKIETITQAGIEDLLQGEGGIGEDGNTVTVVEGSQNTITVNADGSITVQQAKAGDYTGDYQIILNIEGVDVVNGQLALTAQQFEYLSDMLFDAEGNPRLFEVEEKTWPQVELKDANGDTVNQIRVDDNGNPVLDGNGDPIQDPVFVDLKEVITQKGDTVSVNNGPIVLTPSQNNGGTEENGYTTDLDNTIVAGRLDLLHQAYIDGGKGYDVLQVDAKGYFAQPLALLNIEEVQVQNLPNIYGDNSESYPDFATDASVASILDLSRATELEKLVVTEGGYNDLADTTVQPGPLTITGIRNGAETTLDGGFTQNVTLNYGEGQGDGIDLVFNNLDMTATLNVAHNSNTLNIESTGGNNYVSTPNFGGELNVMNISGDAHLFIDGDLDESFRDGTPVTINAAANTGGVTLELSGSQEVTFLGSQADDRVQLQAVSAVTLEGSGGNNVYLVETETATVTLLDGNNQLSVDAEDVNVTAGDGDNTITAEDATTVVVTTGNGDNTISTDTSDSVTITTGTGDDTISSLGSESVTITSEGGDNTIDVSADEMAITTGDGNDTITVSGTDDDAAINGDGNTDALINITTGAGDDTVVLGRGDDGITALEGSSISGENITLRVENVSDLRAAELEGISNVVLNYDVSDALTDDNTSYEVAPALTLTDAQFLAIGAENFSVEGAAFDTYSQLKIIITESTSLTDLGVDSLPAGLDLVLEIRDGVTLEMTAEQLHTKVAPQGVTLADDNNTDQASGKVLITDAGVDFDPFNTNDGVRTEIDGEVYYGGSLSEDFWVDGNDDDTIQYNEWYNVKLDATLNGYNRPADEPSYSRIVIDTDTQGGDLGPFSTYQTFLRMVGESDLTFTPVEGGRDEWGAPIQGGTAIELGVGGEEFIIDFSSVTGEVQNLTIARFEDAAEIYGNGNDVRLNVELTGNVGDDGVAAEAEGGLVSRGVETYVVTDLNDADREFWTCETTQDLETLGLQGNYGNTITFGNTERGVEFLMEVAYSKAEGEGYSVGSVNGLFARGDGATATFNVVGLSDLPADEVQKVAGIDTNATSAVVNIEGGNTVIEALNGTALESLTLNADGDVEVEGGLPGTLESIDATGIDGSFTAAFEPAGDFTFEGAQTGSELTLEGTFEATDATSIDGGSAGMTLVIDGAADITLEDATLANINTVVLEEGAELNITFAQAIEIGAENFVLAEGADDATLNLSGLGEEPFALADFAEGVNVDVVTIAAQPEVTLHADTDLTDIANLQVPEGTILNLTAAQFQQLTDGQITGIDGTTDFTVNITDLTQADVDNGIDLSGVVADNTTLTLTEDVTVPEQDGGAVPPVNATDLGTFAITIGEFTFTLPLITQADGLTITGDAGSVLAFTDVSEYDTTSATGTDGIDASGFDVDILKALNVLVDDQNIEQLFAGLDSDVTVEIYNDLGFLQPVFRTVIVNEGTTVPGFLAFNNIDDASELRTLDLNLMGGTEISGNIDLTNTDGTDTNLIPQRFDTLTINSEGSAENLLNGETANVITGNITATPATTDPDVNPSVENNLKNVVINAAQDFVLEGSLVFSSVGEDERFEATADDAAEVTLTITGDADVTLKSIDTTDTDIESLVIDHTGTGTLTITAGSDALELDNTESLTFTGSGDIVLDTNDEDAGYNGIEGNELSVIDASAHTGDLTLGVVEDIDSTDFAFTSGTGVTTMTLAGDILGFEDTSGGDFDAPGVWSFDYTNAAEGSELRLGDLDFTTVADSTLNIDMGTNGTLYIDADTDLTGVDLTYAGDQSIVLAKGVELKLTAAQASNLNIVAADDVITDETAPNYDAGDVPTVTISELGEAEYDFIGIQAEIAGNVTLGPASVALHEGTNLGDFTVKLDGTTAQVIGFTTQEQADGQVVITGGNGEHSIAWLFNEVINKPVDASGYSGTITRLYLNDQLVVSDSNVESLYTGLSPEIVIINIQFTGDLDDLLNTIALTRTFEVQAFADLENGLELVDGDDLRFLQNIDIKMGGQVEIGNISLDNIIGADVEGGDAFGTLTISSELFDFDAAHGPDNALAPQEWEEPALDEDDNPIYTQVTPDAINTIGNISSGPERDDLRTVVLNTGDVIVTGGNSGAALDIQTITFSGDATADPVNIGATVDTATLNLNGANDITVKGIDAGGLDFVLDTSASTDPDMDAFIGTYTLTGGSPALIGTSDITIQGEEASQQATINLGVDDDLSAALTANPGIVSDTLESLDASTFGGELNVHLSDVAQDFTFTSGTGQTTVVLNGADLALEEDGEWTFNMGSAAPDSQLIFTDAVALNGGSLTIDLGNETMLVTGGLDLTKVDLSVTDTSIEVAEGASITMTAAQVAAAQEDGTLSITGKGQVFITELGDEAVDLSGIQNTGGGTITLVDEAAITLHEDTDLTGALELQIGDTDLTLSAGQMMANAPKRDENGDLDLDGDGDVQLEEVGLEITGATGTVDVTGYENGDSAPAADLDLANVQTAIAGTLILSANAEASADTDFGDFAIDIGTYQLTASAGQLDGVTVNNAPGGGVFVTNLELTPEADLSDVLTADGNESLVNAQLTTTTDETITLTAEKLGIAKVFIAGPGTVNVEGTFLDYDRDEDGEIVTTGEMARFEVNVGATLALTAEQADGREVEGDGTLNIGDLGQGPADIDLSNIALATGAFAAVATDLTLESDADLGQVGEGEGVLFAVEEGITFALNSRQADEQRIEGEGSTLIDTVGEQVREVQITEADSNAGQQSITINYTLNGEAGSVTVNNSVTDFTGQAAITNALLAAFASVNAITAANAGNGLLRLTADAEVDFTIDSIAAVDTDDVLEAEVADSYLVSEDELGDVATAEKELTFDQDVRFNGILGGDEEQTLTLTGTDQVQFDITGGTLGVVEQIMVGEDVELRLNADDADELTVAGDGTVRVADVNGPLDLSDIAVDTVLELNGNQEFFNTEDGLFNTTVQVTVEDGQLDISGLDGANDNVPANLPGSFVVADGAAVRMTQAQGNTLAASGDGDVVIELSAFGDVTDVDNNADFSAITAATELELQDDDVVFGGSIGATSVTVSGEHQLTLHESAIFGDDVVFTVAEENTTLRLSAAQANGLTIVGPETGTAGTVIITDLADTLDADLSNVSVDTFIALEGADPAAELAFTGSFNANANVFFGMPENEDTNEAELDITGATLTAYDAPDATAAFTVSADVTLILTDDQADARPIKGAGDVTVTMDVDSSADLSAIEAVLTISLTDDVEFDGVFPSGATVNVTGDFEFDITAVDVADLPNGFELSGTDLVITAAQGDELAVTGGSSVRVTALQAALDGGAVDLSGITVSDELPGVVAINEDTTVGEGELNLGDISVTLDGDGQVVGYEGFTFEVAEGASLNIENFDDIFGDITFFNEAGEEIDPAPEPDANDLFGTDAGLEALFGDSLGTVTVQEGVNEVPVWFEGAPVTEPEPQSAVMSFTDPLNEPDAAEQSYEVEGFDLRIDFDQDLDRNGDGVEPLSGSELGAGFTLTLSNGNDEIEITGLIGRLDDGSADSRLELRLEGDLVVAWDGTENHYTVEYSNVSTPGNFTVDSLDDLTATLEYDGNGNLQGLSGRVVTLFENENAIDVELTGFSTAFRELEVVDAG